MSAETFEFTTATPCEHVIFTELDGREGVLVDLNTRKYYQLNETASFIWRRLEKRSSAQDIANELTNQYEVTLEQAALSVTRALKQFQSEKLLQL